MKTKISLFSLILVIVMMASCKKDDNSNSSSTNTTSNITKGTWKISYYHESGDDHTTNYNGYTFSFYSNGTLSATNSGGTISGTWNNDDSSNEFHISLGNTAPLSDLNNGWLITTNTSTEFDLKDDNSAHQEEVHFTKI